MEPTGNKRMPNDAKIAPKSSLGAFDFLVFFTLIFRYNCKHDHGALVGLTLVKGASVENFFYFLKKKKK